MEKLMYEDSPESYAKALDEVEADYVIRNTEADICINADTYHTIRLLRKAFYELSEIQAMEKEFMNSPISRQESSNQEN